MSQRYLDIAKREMGVHETAGSIATARIVDYAKHTTLKATSDEIPWCSSFANFVVDTAGDRGTGSAAARSWLDWGVPIPNPVPGCIAVLDRRDRNNPHAAHVTFFAGDSDDPAYFLGLGGNQHDSVSISKQAYSKVLGFRDHA
jgi:uncharacterized protein (TIGR02594 family)